ncbi:MAG: DUF4301 family protein [Cyclobacteriaceae bacterium]|nr:DUF4301 family protein [Cyclobacteriaceae bacterium]
MFTQSDIEQIAARGSVLETVNRQIENFKKGFPFLNLQKAATPGDGILVLESKEATDMIGLYEQNSAQMKIVKFVPASGAASRMFKLLYEFLDIANDKAKVEAAFQKSDHLQSIRTFFERIHDFAFANTLNEQLRQQGKSIDECLAKKDYASILNTLLQKDGLGYGDAPKGLLEFHKYDAGSRTPAEEHMVEGALYARSAGDNVHIHFTVSPEHKAHFEAHVHDKTRALEEKFGVKYHVSFSEQKSYTDTIAVDLYNEPFREANGDLLFRPAGHGALIANLNDLEADMVFIKNIDNVVPDKLKDQTVEYKKILAGSLLHFQKKIFAYLERLDAGVNAEQISEMMAFLNDHLHTKHTPKFDHVNDTAEFLRSKFDRPIRVCGIVKNEGEPGGGPFYAYNQDGTQSLQIAETSQIDFEDAFQKNIANAATHFNPTDLVCAVRNYKGQKFDLTKFIDASTGFISKKSKDGRDLKAQELPGLWNGSMSDWNTFFVEVPTGTFNPVKTVNDLLRPSHQ